MTHSARQVVALVVGLFMTALAYAGSSQGQVQQPLALAPNVFIFAAGTQNNRAACSTVGNWAVNVNTAGGRSMQATVMLAYALGKQVVVSGSGVCDVWGDRETPNYVYIVD